MSSHYREMIVAEAIDVFVGAVSTHSIVASLLLQRALTHVALKLSNARATLDTPHRHTKTRAAMEARLHTYQRACSSYSWHS